MTSRRYSEGEEVLVGTFDGRRRKRGTVAEPWHGVGCVLVLLDGKSKPKPFAPGRVRPVMRHGPPVPQLVRRPDPKGGELRAVPRPPKPPRNPRYRAFVRSHACLGCHKRSPMVEAHHWYPRRGMGQKVSDYATVPLCVRPSGNGGCHEHFHRTAALPHLDPRTTREVFLKAQRDLLEEWILKLRAGGEENRAR